MILTQTNRNKCGQDKFSVTICHLVAVDSVYLPNTLADPVQFTIGAYRSPFKSFKQDISHHPIFVLDLVLGKLHHHESLGGDFFRKQEASETLNVLEVLASCKERFELATDHCPGSVTGQTETVDEDIQMILKETELDARREKGVIEPLSDQFVGKKITYMAQVSGSLSVGMVLPFMKLKISYPVLTNVGMCILMLPRSRVTQPLIFPVVRSMRTRTFCAWASKARP